MTTQPRDAPRPRAVSARVAWGARLGYVFIRMLAATWRVRQHNDAPWRTLRARKSPYVFALWHHDMLAMVWAHRQQQVAVLVSEHGDGEIIARILAGLGNTTVRGSTTRGGARALIGMIHALEGGGSAAITPDGPRGPRHVWQRGVFTAATRAHASIVCVGIAVSRAWRFNSWDKFVLPKPFARIDIVYGEPQLVRNASDDFEQETARFTEMMAQLGERARTVAAGG